MTKKGTAVILIFVLWFSLLPTGNIWANQTLLGILEVRAFMPDDPVGTKVIKGQKNVSYQVRQIDFAYEASLSLAVGKSLSSIKVYAGTEDETYKFDIGITGNILRLQIKAGADHMPYYQLQKHKLYKIVIPQGLLKNSDGTKVNGTENFTFVTNRDTGVYRDDILKDVVPGNGAQGIDYRKGTITFEFVDLITLHSQIYSYIEMATSPVAGGIPGDASDSMANYTVRAEGNKLILTAKDGKFKDFAVYTVKLKEQALYLSGSADSDGKIYNGPVEISFTTDDMVESTNPVNNGTNIEVEPVLTFHFKHPIQYDAGKIKLVEQAAGGEIPIDVTAHGKSLSIAVKEDGGNQPLKKNTLYRATILAGGVSFTEYPSVHNTVNIDLYFTTGNQGQNPMPSAYGSTETFGDDIRNMEKTQLGENGAVYIKMNRPIRWDKDWSGDDKKEARKDKVTLYKMPMAEDKGYSSKGQVYDKAYGYVKDGVSGVFKLKSLENYKEKVTIEELEIVGSNRDILKIKPKMPFLSCNAYQLIIDQEIIEDHYGHNLSSHMDFQFWTKGNGTGSPPLWNTPVMGTAKTEEITGMPYKKFRITGTAKFSPTEPMVLSLPVEVIPGAAEGKIEGNYYRNKALERILLRSTYYEEKLQLMGNSLESIPEVRLDMDKTIQFSLVSGANPTGEPVRWISENPAVASVDSQGKARGIARGQTQVLALDKMGNLLGKARIVVEEALHVAELKLEYDEVNNGKSTKIFLYPNQELEAGRSYKLFIPAAVFQTRGKAFAPALELELVVDGDDAVPAYVEAIENGTVSVGDLISKSEIVFWIKGTNFSPGIENVQLTAGDKTIAIDPQYVQYMGTDQLRVTIKNPLKATLASEAYVGDYTVAVNFQGGRTTMWKSGHPFRILTMGPPKAIGKYPAEGGSHDEKSFVHGVKDSFTNGKYFLRFTFEDADGSLSLNGETGLTNLSDSVVIAAGSGISMIDGDFVNQIKVIGDYEKTKIIEKYVLVKDSSKKEATLYVPVKPLRSQTTYHVLLKAGIVRNTVGQNEEIAYSFHTRTVPYTTGVEMGSVTEDYDIDEPIVLKGDFFESGYIQVYFNEIPAYRVSPEERVGSDGKLKEKILKVYLPRGSNRLKPGVYNVTLSHGPNHQSVLYGSFSVVPAGKAVPHDQYRLKDKRWEGEVKADVKISEDTLLLETRHANAHYLSFDLDEMMGEDVWVRKISYKGDTRDKIGVLETKSKWANITLYGLTLDGNASDHRIVLSLGRTEPQAVQSIQKKLKGSVKSDFIQVAGKNFKAQNIALSIPIKDSKGQNLKIYRYDEETRAFYEIKGTIHLVNQKVEFMSSNPGIFVIVESLSER